MNLQYHIINKVIDVLICIDIALSIGHKNMSLI